MADNVTLPGTGSIVASDEVGGAQYQIVKIGLGAANAVDGHLDAGQTTMANSLPVTIASDQGAIGTVGVMRKTYTYYTGQKTASGDNTVVSAPAAGNRIVVAMIEVQNTTTTATTVILKNGSTSVWTHYNALQGDALAIHFNRGDEWLLGDAAALVVNLSGANSHNVSVAYYTEAV